MAVGQPLVFIAITHVPSPALAAGERTHVARVPIDFALAEEQHAGYRRMLEACGARVIVLGANIALPDSVFVEDTAIVLDECAIITPMGVESRRPEPAVIAEALRPYRETRPIMLPATIEGGDVVRTGRTILVGLSSRTNPLGVEALREATREFGYEVRAIEMQNALHFKSACTALPDGRLLVNPAWVRPSALAGFELVTVPPEDPWGANVTLVGDHVCAASEHGPTNERLRGLGYDVHDTPLGEFAKAEGAVTCMSLIVRM